VAALEAAGAPLGRRAIELSRFGLQHDVAERGPPL
jgi:hypothetical protein